MNREQWRQNFERRTQTRIVPLDGLLWDGIRQLGYPAPTYVPEYMALLMFREAAAWIMGSNERDGDGPTIAELHPLP